MTCTCALPTPGFRQCPEHRRYWFGPMRLYGVSTVAGMILPTDWSKIPKAVLENARDRGETVDRWFMEYLRTGTVVMPDNRLRDREEYLDRLITWWERHQLKASSIQEVVMSEADGVVGILDLGIQDAIWDLKCTASLSASYRLQLGGYGAYHPSKRVGGIIHVTKKDVRMIGYSHDDCLEKWSKGVTWWKVRRELDPKQEEVKDWV